MRLSILSLIILVSGLNIVQLWIVSDIRVAWVYYLLPFIILTIIQSITMPLSLLIALFPSVLGGYGALIVGMTAIFKLLNENCGLNIILYSGEQFGVLEFSFFNNGLDGINKNFNC